MPLRKLSAWRNLSKFLQNPKVPKKASGETGIARGVPKSTAFCRLLGATPLFPPHVFGAEEEQKLTAASVEAQKSESLAVDGTAGFYHILWYVFNVFQNKSLELWYLMTMPHQLVKDFQILE